MKIKLISFLLIMAAPLLAQEKDVAVKAGAPAETQKKYPLRGIIIEVLTDKGALVVKHEDIPGLMPAMTMRFNLEPGALNSLAKGQTITATLTKENGEFCIHDVKRADLPAK